MNSTNREQKLFADLNGAQEEFIVTQNQMGFMTTKPDEFSQQLIDYAAQASEPMLEIGAAYGVATIRAIEQGAVVIANDLEPKHLEILQQKLPENMRNQLILKPGRFPDELNLPTSTVSCALACRVIHFFDGDTIRHALAKLYDWIKPGGKLAVVVETPYVKPFIPILNEYERRVKSGMEWPGCFDNIHEIYAKYAPELVSKVPPLLHYLDENILRREIEKAGFIIEKCHTINRTDFPEWLRLDGRESCGVIAYKP